MHYTAFRGGNLGTLIIAVLSLFCGMSTALALGPGDFYCSEKFFFEQAPGATYYRRTGKLCDGKPASESGTCAMVVPCAYISDQVKATINKQFHTDFAHLTEDQKTLVMKDQESLPSTLTCPAVSDDPTDPVCPSPDRCKGDVLQGVVQTARFDPAQTAVYNTKYWNHALKRFQAGPGAQSGSLQQ
jgi:hypothetical protein